MQLEKVKVKIRCEMGACKQRASYTIRMARVGIRSRIHVCEECLENLAKALEEAKVVAVAEKPITTAVPKSVETLKPKKKGDR